MSALTSGMNLMGYISYQYMIKGIVLVSVVIFDVATEIRKNKNLKLSIL